MSHTDIALTALFCTGQVVTVAVLAWRAHRSPKAPAPSGKTGQAFDASATAEWVNGR